MTWLLAVFLDPSNVKKRRPSFVLKGLFIAALALSAQKATTQKRMVEASKTTLDGVVVAVW